MRLRVRASGFGVWGYDLGCGDYGSGFRVRSVGFMLQGSELGDYCTWVIQVSRVEDYVLGFLICASGSEFGMMGKEVKGQGLRV